MDSTDFSSLIQMALAEDMPQDDLTTDLIIKEEKIGKASLIAQQDLTLSGCNVFAKTILSLDSKAKFEWLFEDGHLVLEGQKICIMNANLTQLLKTECTSLKFLSHLSGIATLTRQFVNKVAATKTKILDTRKTTPGLRHLEKQAVLDGGGLNHPLELSSEIIIKEKHILMGGGLAKTIEQVRQESEKSLQVEVKSLNEVKKAIELNIERLRFKNMSHDEMAESLKLIPDSVITEANGNITIKTVASVAQLGVNYISIDALTHSAPCVRLNLLFDEAQFKCH